MVSFSDKGYLGWVWLRATNDASQAGERERKNVAAPRQTAGDRRLAFSHDRRHRCATRPAAGRVPGGIDLPRMLVLVSCPGGVRMFRVLLLAAAAATLVSCATPYQ